MFFLLKEKFKGNCSYLGNIHVLLVVGYIGCRCLLELDVTWSKMLS